MTYSTNQRNIKDDLAEAKRLFQIIAEYPSDTFSECERSFINSVTMQVNVWDTISEGQLHILRSIKDKALES